VAVAVAVAVALLCSQRLQKHPSIGRLSLLLIGDPSHSSQPAKQHPPTPPHPNPTQPQPQPQPLVRVVAVDDGSISKAAMVLTLANTMTKQDIGQMLVRAARWLRTVCRYFWPRSRVCAAAAQRTAVGSSPPHPPDF